MPDARPRPSRFRLPRDVRPTEYDLHLEPDLDAGRFSGEVRITMRLDRARAAVSNGPVEREESAGGRGGKRIVRFARTPPLSTYLLALAVGPLEASPIRQAGPTPIRIWHVPGKGQLVDFGLEAAAEALRRLE